ncbi:hypothetical protein [Planomonospora sp. ID82291]|uniref:hypothetical protein n=1 Tax=Planomonospora sp. ID82291 TaxID=2738136 RepID=UPI0018C37C88|nr:hypothetical protein [Planomonospora sp. ID82291]MBG0813431.1 hypothetical protein [Planomonospora sp. ID82291]
MGTWSRRLPPSPGRLRLIVREVAARLRRGRTPGKGEREDGREDGLPARRALEACPPPVVRVTERTAVRLHRAAAGLAEVTSEVNAYAELLEEKAHELRTRARDRERAPAPPASPEFSTGFSTGRSGRPPEDGKLPSRRLPT